MIASKILDTTQKIFGTKENRNYLADLVMQVHDKRLHDQSVLKMLKEDKEQTEKSITNIMKAIEQGILTGSTKSRLNELEEHLQDVNAKILIEQSNAQKRLKKPDIIEYLKHTIKKEPKLLIQMLIHKIIIYDDKVEIYYNYTDKKSPDDNRRDSSFMAGSDTSNQSPPKNIEKLLRMGGFSHFIPKSILKNLNFFIVELFITFENNEYKKQVRKKYEFCNTLSSMVIFLRVKTGLALFETAPYNVIILLLKLKSMLYYHSHPDYCYFCERQHYI